MTGLLAVRGAWFSIEPKCSADVADNGAFDGCIGPYNEEILGRTQETARIIMAVLVVLQAIMCIFCYRWRKIGSYFIYSEIII